LAEEVRVRARDDSKERGDRHEAEVEPGRFDIPLDLALHHDDTARDSKEHAQSVEDGRRGGDAGCDNQWAVGTAALGRSAGRGLGEEDGGSFLERVRGEMKLHGIGAQETSQNAKHKNVGGRETEQHKWKEVPQSRDESLQPEGTTAGGPSVSSAFDWADGASYPHAKKLCTMTSRTGLLGIVMPVPNTRSHAIAVNMSRCLAGW
jgi:hypothetical protein